MKTTGQTTWMETLESRRLLSGIDQVGDIGYLFSGNGSTLQRYDVGAEQWLAPVALANAPGEVTASLVDADGIYVAYGQIVMRYDLGGGAPTHLMNTSSNVHELHSDGDVLFLNHSSGLYARFISIDKQTNAIIDVATNYVDSVYGSSISTSANRIFGRTKGVSPSDITFMGYDDAGRFTGGGDSPYHGDYAGASTTWVFPQGTKVVDDSGGVYAASDLNRLNSFDTRIDDIAFLGGDVPIVLHDDTLTAYSPAILPTGSRALPDPASQILVNDASVIAFNPDAGEPNGYDVQIVPLADLNPKAPGEPVNPVGLAYDPEDIEVAADGTLLILDAETQSIFRWDVGTRQYGQTIPLVDVPRFMAYSEANDAVYVAYAGGLINQIDLAAAVPSEEPFTVLSAAPLGLSAAGEFLFAVDGSGAWVSHYTYGPDGAAISAVDWNYYSSEYVWSEANSKMYFFRDDTSPNDLLSEAIGDDGRIGAKDDSPLHSSAGFRHPIRVAPDGGVVILGSGVVHDAQTLARLPGGLPNAVADIAWLGDTVYTVRSIAGYTQFQQWVGPTFAPGRVTQVYGTPHALLSVGDDLVGVYTPISGVPRFRVMGGDLSSDVTPPAMLGGLFSVDDRRITLTASEDLDAASGDATVTLLAGGVPIDVAGTVSGDTISFDLPARLADGDYELTVPRGAVRDTAYNGLAADYEFDFFVLAGDADRDRAVTIADFALMRSGFGGPGLFSDGDFNYDGQVTMADFAILRSNFGKSLARPVPSLFADDDRDGEAARATP